MNSNKIIAISVLFFITLVWIGSTINSLNAINVEDNTSEIVFVDTQNDYEVYAEESEVGYLQVTVID